MEIEFIALLGFEVGEDFTCDVFGLLRGEIVALDGGCAGFSLGVSDLHGTGVTSCSGRAILFLRRLDNDSTPIALLHEPVGAVQLPESYHRHQFSLVNHSVLSQVVQTEQKPQFFFLTALRTHTQSCYKIVEGELPCFFPIKACEQSFTPQALRGLYRQWKKHQKRAFVYTTACRSTSQVGVQSC